MIAQRQCWWCGRTAEVDTELPEPSGLVRDDTGRAGRETWICTDNGACVHRALMVRWGDAG